uniref:DRBM domain-containing protein n=2 Tax=Timema TaxID=61471 RepID=A0A7R9JUI8_TIMGE|nr:unnamed protein product [Timema genevievae]
MQATQVGLAVGRKNVEIQSYSRADKLAQPSQPARCFLLGVLPEGENATIAGQHTLQPAPISPTNNVNNTTTSNISTNLANTKEKTPMCLVNELARFNKIQHQYRLTNEQGPAHKKRFTVTLKLGEEEYSAEGASIKKAQHSAANEALQHTQYKHPPPKTTRSVRLGKSNITPTVELNALAMKRGEPAVYTFIEPSHNGTTHNPYMSGPPPPPTSSHNYNYRGIYNQRYHQYKAPPGSFHPPMFVVSLRVGAREFFGDGPTAQAARHDAASKALNNLKTLPLPEDVQHCELAMHDSGISCGIELDPNAELKSPISLIHEIALKRNLPVIFEVISEKGPPHMRTFITKCSVGDKVTTGEGNGKKVSKKRAAEKMLEELKKLPPTSPTNMAATVARLKRKANPGKKKTRNLIKVYQQHLISLRQVLSATETTRSANAAPFRLLPHPTNTTNVSFPPPPSSNFGTCFCCQLNEFILWILEQKSEPEYGEDINPISRLIQIQQAKKEREPVYSLLEERGVPRRREFVMEVSIGQTTCTGSGPNKKLAKRAAAEGLLEQLGYLRPTTQPVKPTIKAVVTDPLGQDLEKNRKVTFLEDEKSQEIPPGGSSGRQLVPGLLLMADGVSNSYIPNTPSKAGVNLQTTATIAKELLKGGNSPTAEALAKSIHKNKNVITGNLGKSPQNSNQNSQVVRPKDQLLYLAQLLNFNVQFSDFPKAALTALRALSEMGLDSVSPSGGGHKDPVNQVDG